MSDAQRDALAPTTLKVLASCQPGLTILLEALESAKELQRDIWDFAVEIHNLRSAGLTSSNLRWLLCKGYAEHAVETTRPQAAQRTFRPAGNLMLCQGSCFVLTPAGATLARVGCPVPQKCSTPKQAPAPSSQPADWSEAPRWDGERHELRWGAKLVKRFREPARNQELILAAFEEEGWPPHIDDPLPSPLSCDAKRRLHDTIKRLNRRQVNRLIRFRSDGSGSGVIWEFWGYCAQPGVCTPPCGGRSPERSTQRFGPAHGPTPAW